MNHLYSHQRLLAASLSVVAACFGATQARGQTLNELQRQDSHFIDWMKEKGAAEAMAYYAKEYPSNDPKVVVSMRIAVERTTIEAAREKARNLQSAAEVNQVFLEMRKATESLLQAERDRCEKFGDDDVAVLWQNQLLSDILEEYLRVYRNNAVEVYEYGSPNDDQTKAYEEWMPLAFAQANRASAVAFESQGKMISDGKYGRQLTKLGLKTKVQDAQSAAKYWLGSTAFGMTLLPDNHPYFAKLGKPGGLAVPQQKATIADERKRLLALALDAVGSNDPANLSDELKALGARALAAQGKFAEAKKYANALNAAEFTAAAQAPLAARTIAVKAKVLAAAGAMDEAVKTLRLEALQNPALAADLAAKGTRSYLFVCDAAHRLLMDASKKAQPAAAVELLNKAFMEPYADVFSDQPDPGLDPEVAAAIRQLRPELNARWKQQFAAVPLAQIPPAVASGTIMLEMGELLGPGGLWEKVKTAVAAKQAPDANDVKSLTEKMRRIESGLLPLSTHPVKVVRAKMLDQLALLRYLGIQAGISLVADPAINISLLDQTAHAAALNWLAIADEMPETSQAPQAMEYATFILRTQLDAGLYAADYLKCCGVLFAKYPNSPAALRELTKYSDLLAGQGKHKEAEEILGKMPKTDNYYFIARQKMVSLKDRNRKALQGAADSAKAAGTPSAEADAKFQAALADVIQFADGLVNEAKQVAKEAPGYRRASAVSVRASTLVLLANAYNAKGNPQQGVALLDSLESEFSQDAIKPEDVEGNEDALKNMRDGLAAQVEWGQICRMRMLMDAGLGDQVKTRAQQLLASGNAQSVAVLRGLNRDLKVEVDSLKDEISAAKFAPYRAELEVRRQRYGKAMLDLTELLRAKLLATANEQETDYLNVLLVQSKSASGDTAGAVALAEQLLAGQEADIKAGKRKSRSLNLILGAAQATFDHAKSILDANSKERQSMLAAANKSAKRIVDNFRRNAPGATGYPVEFYEAFWVHMSALEALPLNSSRNMPAIRASLPNAIKAVREADPKGYEALPWNSRFEKLMLRLETEK